MTRAGQDALNPSLILLCALFLLLCLLLAQEDSDTQSWFSLTSQRTFLPGEKPEISVNAHNVKQLEFRVYRVNDPVKFFSQMQELHNFGGQAPALPKQAHTWLERFHAWKHRIWAWVRDFVRAQFSTDSRHQIRLWRLGGRTTEGRPQGRKLRASSRTQPAASRVGMEVDGAVPRAMGELEPCRPGKRQGCVSGRGDGRQAARVHHRRHHRDRNHHQSRARTPDELRGRSPQRRSHRQHSSAGLDRPEANGFENTDAQGLVDTSVNAAKPENVAVLAKNADQFAVNAPGAWNLGDDPNRSLKGYTYTDRPVYRPGDTVHFKSIVRAQTATGYSRPARPGAEPANARSSDLRVIWTQTVKLSDMGTAYWNYPVRADGKLGSYYLSMQMGERYVDGTNFSVEDYKKPEYAVKVRRRRRASLKASRSRRRSMRAITSASPWPMPRSNG